MKEEGGVTASCQMKSCRRQAAHLRLLGGKQLVCVLRLCWKLLVQYTAWNHIAAARSMMEEVQKIDRALSLKHRVCLAALWTDTPDAVMSYFWQSGFSKWVLTASGMGAVVLNCTDCYHEFYICLNSQQTQHPHVLIKNQKSFSHPLLWSKIMPTCIQTYC